MILEVAEIQIPVGQNAAFEAAIAHGIQSVRQVHQHRFEQFRFYIPFSEDAAKTSLDIRTTPTGRNPPLVKIFDDR